MPSHATTYIRRSIKLLAGEVYTHLKLYETSPKFLLGLPPFQREFINLLIHIYVSILWDWFSISPVGLAAPVLEASLLLSSPPLAEMYAPIQ